MTTHVRSFKKHIHHLHCDHCIPANTYF